MPQQKLVEQGEDGLLLREVTWSDCKKLYEWRMHEKDRLMFRNTGVVPYADHEVFLKEYLTESGNDRWMILEAAGDPVAAIAIVNSATDGSECELARLVVDPGARNRGYAKTAMRLACRHAKRLGIRRVNVDVDARNLPSLAATRRLGFVEESRRVTDQRTFVKLHLELQ